MTLSGSKYALAAALINGRTRIVEIVSAPNEKGELRCTTGGKNYVIHGSSLRPITSKAVEILRPFGASTAINPFRSKS